MIRSQMVDDLADGRALEESITYGGNDRVELADWRRRQGLKEAFLEPPPDQEISLRDVVDAPHDYQAALSP
jgi:hypothetical protein